MQNNILDSEIPCLIRDGAQQLQRRFGLSPNAAILMLLQISAAIAGSAVRTRNTNAFDFIPTFDIALVSDNFALIHGAQMEALKPIRKLLEPASNTAREKGRRRIHAEYDSNLREHGVLKEKISAIERELSELEKARDYNSRSSAEVFTSVRQSVNEPWRQGRLQVDLADSKDQLLELEESIANGYLSSGPGIIRDGGNWDGILTAGERSFDRNFLQLGGVDSIENAFGSIPACKMRACAQLFRSSRFESPFHGLAENPSVKISMQLSGTTAEFSRVALSTPIAKSGLLHGFLFCNADNENGGEHAEAIQEFSECEYWGSLLSTLLFNRQCAGAIAC